MLPFCGIVCTQRHFLNDSLSLCSMKHSVKNTLALGILERVHRSVPVTNHLPHGGGSFFHCRESLTLSRISLHGSTQTATATAEKHVCFIVYVGFGLVTFWLLAVELKATPAPNSLVDWSPVGKPLSATYKDWHFGPEHTKSVLATITPKQHATTSAELHTLLLSMALFYFILFGFTSCDSWDI